MEEKSSTNVKYVIAAIALCLLLVGSSAGFFFIGRLTMPAKQASRTVQSTVQKELGTETTDTQATTQPEKVAGETIAVVNLDEGIEEDGEIINYATQIMDTVKSDCEVTSLAEARKGLSSGKYGAFVIIPADFSESVNSLSSTPKKATIQYCVSNELNQERQQTVLYNTLDLVNAVNDDVSYIYLNAILKDFHSAQDTASTLMSNDKKLTDSILNIQPIELSNVVNPEKLKQIESPATLSLEDESSNVVKLANKVSDSYSTYIESKSSEYTLMNNSLKNQLDGIASKNKDMTETSVSKDPYNTVDYDKDSFYKDNGLFKSDTNDKEASEKLAANVQNDLDTSVMTVQKEVGTVLLNIRENINTARRQYSTEKQETSEQVENLQTKVDEQSKRISELEKALKEKDKRINELTDESYWNQVVDDATEQVTDQILGSKDATSGIVPEFVLDSENTTLTVKVKGSEKTIDLLPLIKDDGTFDIEKLVKQVNKDVKEAEKEVSESVKSEIHEVLKDTVKYPAESDHPDNDSSDDSDNKQDAEDSKEETSNYLAEGDSSSESNVVEDNLNAALKIIKENSDQVGEGGKPVTIYKLKTEVEVSKMSDYTQQFASTYQKKLKEKNQMMEENQTLHTNYVSEYKGLVGEYKKNIAANDDIHDKVIERLSKYTLPANNTDAVVVNSLNAIDSFGSSMSKKILDYNTETQKYTASVYDAVSKNQNNLIHQMEDAQKKSQNTVNQALTATKSLQTANSIVNQNSLLDFSKSLSYTRLGKNQYKFAYRFIVNPFDLEEVKVTNSN